MESKLINVKAAARLLNRHPSTVSNMMKKGELPHVMLHGRRYIDQAVIERLLAQADPCAQIAEQRCRRQHARHITGMEQPELSCVRRMVWRMISRRGDDAIDEIVHE